MVYVSWTAQTTRNRRDGTVDVSTIHIAARHRLDRDIVTRLLPFFVTQSCAIMVSSCVQAGVQQGLLYVIGEERRQQRKRTRGEWKKSHKRDRDRERQTDRQTERATELLRERERHCRMEMAGGSRGVLRGSEAIGTTADSCTELVR